MFQALIIQNKKVARPLSQQVAFTTNKSLLQKQRRPQVRLCCVQQCGHHCITGFEFADILSMILASVGCGTATSTCTHVTLCYIIAVTLRRSRVLREADGLFPWILTRILYVNPVSKSRENRMAPSVK